jgi:hypothetical protein
MRSHSSNSVCRRSALDFNGTAIDYGRPSTSRDDRFRSDDVVFVVIMRRAAAAQRPVAVVAVCR